MHTANINGNPSPFQPAFNVTGEGHAPHGSMRGLLVAALGIVFGDIGTSPLYALKTVVHLSGDHPTPGMALGLLSLMIWALLVIVAFKYVTLLMSINNRGEGGILSLMALLGMKKKKRPFIIAVALFGAALIYADGAITPAISVLSALEGLDMVAPSTGKHILPIAVVVLILLFVLQSRGTDKIGFIFGPVMILWFAVLAWLGVRGIAQNPHVLSAFNPVHAIRYLTMHGASGYLTLGGVFLCVTGAEALYADMGHVGGKSIRIAWTFIVLPALILNYAGQTALLMQDATGNTHYFYQLCPPEFLLPLIVLATLATVIASQSIITGAFSMTRQAILLGALPRMWVTQTSHKGYGQIYVGAVNWLLMIVTVSLALIFGSSERLAAAYGIAVSMTMLATTFMLYIAMREILHWRPFVAVIVTAFLFIIDLAFFGANLLKVLDGGWVPLLIATVIFTLMQIWRGGTAIINRALGDLTEPVELFLARLSEKKIPRVPGTAVFLTRTKHEMPPILIGHVRRNKALHEHVVIMSIVVEEVPIVTREHRINTECLTPNLWRVRVHYGFMETPDIPEVLKMLPKHGFSLNLKDVTYYVGRETLLLSRSSKIGIPAWQEPIFSMMQRNSNQTPDFLSLPPNRVVEIGNWVEI